MPDKNSVGQSGKDPLKDALLAGIYGTPELRRAERRYYLGQFRERVLKALTIEQVAEPGTYPEVETAIAHPDARRLIINRKADINAAVEYIRLARQHNLTFVTVESADYTGSVGLIVAADRAVDWEEVMVPSRTERLESLGIPRPLIDARGQSVCSKCLGILREKAPEELPNYKKFSWLDLISGKDCICK